MYNITNYSKKKAKELGVEIKPSSNKNKKIDVFKDNKKIASIGASGMNDYPTYMKTKGKAFADERRRLYRARTDWCKDKKVCKLAREILW